MEKHYINIIFSLFFLFITNAYSQTNLPKKAKLKTITYSGYDISGYVYKKHFIEDQKLTFCGNTYSYHINHASKKHVVENQRALFHGATNYYHSYDTILSGRFFYADDGNSYIDGIKIKHGHSFNRITKGIFRITNTKNEVGITANKKEGYKLEILLKDLTYYQDKRYYYNYDNYGTLILQKHSNNKFSLKIKYEALILEIIIPDSLVKKVFNYNFNNYILDSHQVKLSFNNGDVFIGTVKSRLKLPDCDYDSPYAPENGEYRYASGEVSTGVFECNNYYNRFYLEEGVTVFADGSIGNGDWLFQPDLTDSEQEKIYSKDRTPTEMRNMAESIIEEKERKLQEEKEAREQAEKEKLRQEQVHRNKLIEKYGKYYGNKISEGEIVLEMSQEMVNEYWPKKFFNISYINRNNNKTVIWKFDKNKMRGEIIKKGKENGNEDGAIAVFLILNLSEQLGGMDVPKILVFKNNKLTEIYRY